jgi:pseudouridine-5'-phosphate glycosidase
MLKRIKDGLTDLAPDVAEALGEGRAVVALESTIVTHGMPYPQNVETARAVEATVRAAGAVPATIAIIDGRIKVGLQAHQLDGLGSAKRVIKATRRDLAAAIVKHANAGTTVAATMANAARAGIEIFATGGIGGVHRGVERTFDISADLIELAKSPVAVVCAGCKSILDIAKTLEFLETQGVPVVGYGTDEFPAFFARSSGHKIDHRFDDAAEIAALIRMERKLGSRSGILIANPIPEEHALPAAEIEERIAAAVKDAERAGVSQKAVTPYLLARINELTGGKSLTANIALVKNSAALAAEIAVALAELPVEA